MTAATTISTPPAAARPGRPNGLLPSPGDGRVFPIGSPRPAIVAVLRIGLLPLLDPAALP